MDKNSLNFLNNKETPSPEEIYGAFEVLSDISKYITDITEEEWDDLGEPDTVVTKEGTEWEVTRMVWETPKGPVAKFLITNINIEFDKIININYEDIDDEDGPDDFILEYNEKLQAAIESENYHEASMLRDWKIDLDALEEKLKPLMRDSLEEGDYLKLNEYLTAIKHYYKTII